MKEIVMATNNAGKLKEVQAILAPLEIKVLSLKDVFDDPIDIEETGTTFEENALIKATTIRDMIHKVVIADDSGLEIDALDKQPGVQSARFLGHDTSYDIKNNYLIELLKDQTNRQARYVCAMAIAFEDGTSKVFRETMEGEISKAPAGTGGFGYDPIFYLPEKQMTVAQLGSEEKNKFSHRAKALAHLVDIVKGM